MTGAHATHRAGGRGEAHLASRPHRGSPPAGRTPGRVCALRTRLLGAGEHTPSPPARGGPGVQNGGRGRERPGRPAPPGQAGHRLEVATRPFCPCSGGTAPESVWGGPSPSGTLSRSPRRDGPEPGGSGVLPGHRKEEAHARGCGSSHSVRVPSGARSELLSGRGGTVIPNLGKEARPGEAQWWGRPHSCTGLHPGPDPCRRRVHS